MTKNIYPHYSNRNLIIAIIIGAIVIGLYNFLAPSDQEFLCEKLRSIESKKINGIVKDRYIDKNNHNYEIVEYFLINDTTVIRRLNLTLDTTSLFDLVEPGDTLGKRSGSLLVAINKDTSIRLDYGVKCDDN